MRKRWQKYCALFLLRFMMFCVCVCVFIPLSQGQLLERSQISLMSLEVIQNLCAFTYSWVKPGAQTERGGGGKGQLFMVLLKQVPWLLLGMLTHLFIFRKKWILSMGETQASDLLLGALIKGLS